MTRTTRTRAPSTLSIATLLVLIIGIFAPLGAQSVKQVTVDCVKKQFTVGETTTCTVTARRSNGQFASVAGATWLSSNTTVATVPPTSGAVTAKANGSAIVSATVSGKTGSVALTVGSAPAPTPTPTPTPTPAPAAGDAELPRVFLTTTVASTPSNGRTLRVAAGGNVQAALDSACSGDRVLLRAGAVYSGNFNYGPKSCGTAGEWITVETDSTLPPEGTRVSPAIAAQYRFPKLIAPNSTNTLVSAPGAKRWRFIGIEVTVATTVLQNQGTILVGDASAAQNTVASIPSDIIFDRVYVHGHPELAMVKCIALDAARSAVIDSYVSDCHSSFDAQAITMRNGPGPFKIVNNYLEGSGETLMFGGSDPSIPNIVPSDIEVRRNHITRLMAWRGKWLQKELIESKNSSHVLVEANVLENTWVDGQYGWIMGLWSVNQNGTCTWCVTEHWTVRNNLARNVTSGWSLSGKYETQSPLAHHITITNNLVIGLDNPAIQGYGRIFQIQNVGNLRIEHNTAFTPYNPTFSYDAGLMPNHIVKNNLVGGGQYQIFCGCGQGSVAWSQVAGPGSAFEGNVVALFPAWLYGIPNNEYPATLADIGLVGGETAAYSVTAAPMDLSLASTSLYKGKATDGKDPGADVAVVLAATQGVVQSGALSATRATTKPRSTTTIPIRKP